MAPRTGRPPEWIWQALEQWKKGTPGKQPGGEAKAGGPPARGPRREGDLPPQLAKVISLILSLMAALYALAWFAGWLEKVLPR